MHTNELPLLPANTVRRQLTSYINFLEKLTIQDSLGESLWSFCCTRAADLSVFVMSPQERTYIPEDQRHTNKNSQAFCYSETIPAPTGKDDAQQKSVSSLPLFEEPVGFHPWALRCFLRCHSCFAFSLFKPCTKKETVVLDCRTIACTG